MAEKLDRARALAMAFPYVCLVGVLKKMDAATFASTGTATRPVNVGVCLRGSTHRKSRDFERGMHILFLKVPAVKPTTKEHSYITATTAMYISCTSYNANHLLLYSSKKKILQSLSKESNRAFFSCC